MYQELAKYVSYATGLGTVWGLYGKFFTIRNLKKEIGQLKKEKADLDKEQGMESIRRVERVLLKLSPAVCPICKDLIFLSLSTTFVGALVRLGALLDHVAGWQSIPNTATIKLLLETLDKACQLRLWSWSLEKSDGRSDLEQLLVRRAIEVYTAVVPHLTGAEKETAALFCIDCCERKTGDLQREVAVLLLPRMLRHSPEDQRLADSYLNLLQMGQGDAIPEEQQALLHGLISGLQAIAEINTSKVLSIWQLAFLVAAAGGDWRRLMLQRWRMAVSLRLPHSSKDELVNLRTMIAEYMTNHPDAPFHDSEYFEISNVAADVRQAINPTDKGFRPPNRAVVSLNSPIPVQIILKGHSSSTKARLVNFSVDDVETVWKRGAWATGSLGPQSPQFRPGVWCDATVIVDLPTPIVFEQARVNGVEEVARAPLWGYRIQLGPPTREDTLIPLKRKWELLPKR